MSFRRDVFVSLFSSALLVALPAIIVDRYMSSMRPLQEIRVGPDHRLTPVPAVGSRLFLGLEQADVGRRPVRRPESNRCQRYRTSCFNQTQSVAAGAIVSVASPSWSYTRHLKKVYSSSLQEATTIDVHPASKSIYSRSRGRSAPPVSASLYASRSSIWRLVGAWVLCTCFSLSARA